MTVRSAYMALQTSDMAALSRAPTELGQLATIAPKLALYRDAMLAALELLRGKPERARQAYEQLFSLPEAEFMMAHWADRTMYARALSALGQHAEARAVCEALLAKVGPDEVIYVRKGAIQQLALALAAGGEIEAATQQLDSLIARLAPYDNPLWSGTAQRERAKVALFAEDQAGFERHARAMTEHYQSTRNPALIQQCDLLYAAAKAQTRGVRQSAALNEAALAFETHQSRVVTSADMDRFETEMMPEGGPANDQAKIASEG
jgi:tetratricopeptide (TPR) repeat protein